MSGKPIDRDPPPAQTIAEQFRRVLGSASDMVCLVDVARDRLYMNAAARRMFFPPDHEGEFEKPFTQVIPEDRERARDEFREIVRTGMPRRLDARALDRDGRTRLLRNYASPIRDASGQVAAIVVIIHDVTDERRLDAALWLTIKTLFEQPTMAIGITDLEGHFVSINETGKDLLGYPPGEDYSKRSVFDVVHPDDRARVEALRANLVADRISRFNLEKRIVRGDGEMRWVNCDMAIVRPPLEGRSFIVVLASDITRRKQDEEQARQLSRRLVELQETERRDIARELHDRVGQTLTALRINQDMIRMRAQESGDTVIGARVEDSLDLVQSAFKAVENLMYDLRPPMLDEHGVVAAIRWHSRAFAERTGIHVDVRGDEAWRCGPDVELALFRIAQEALNNVARHAEASEVAIELRDTGLHVVLTIDDDGVGFDQGAERAPRSYGLTGMRERAQALDGTFDAVSEKGKGTRIAVTVPKK